MRARWYFDFISPFAYLQLGRFRDLPSELEITLKPVLFSALLDHWGQIGTSGNSAQATVRVSLLQTAG